MKRPHSNTAQRPSMTNPYCDSNTGNFGRASGRSTSKGLKLAVPETLLATADQVIE
jgi:hypothetical protein